MPSVANALVYRLENARENPAYCSSEEAHHMVVLGGGIDLYVNTDSPYEILKPDSLIRILRAPEFASPNTQYYLLGGGAGERTLATNMKAVLLDLNIDASAIIVESKSKSTHENAQALRTILPPDQNQTIFLVTSALHVNRAAATFEKVGYQVCHLGLDTQYSIPKLPVSLLPYLSGLNKTTLALHESIASIVYQIKGHL